MRISGHPECPLCGKPSARDDAFFPAHTDGLPVDTVRSMFHPPGLHWGCYLSWPGRADFGRRLFRRLVAEAGGLWGRAYDDGRVVVLIHVCEPYVAQLLFADTGRQLLVPPADWGLWRASPELVAPQCHPVERDGLRRALVPVWERFPDVAALVAGTDWTGAERHLYEWPERT